MLHPLFKINMNIDILPFRARYVKPREIILVRFQSHAEFQYSCHNRQVLSEKIPSMVLQFIVIVTSELNRPFNSS